MSLRNLFTDILPQKREVLVVFSLFIFSLIGLFLYSFTQVDLSLTITRTSFWQPIQHFFQYIGYFNRPLSTLLYLIIIGFLSVCYILFLRFVQKGILKGRTVWFLILSTSILFVFSYNSFSYDIFNYIFDAKIITHYGQNPYFHKALDYPTDPMLSFMRWTHRTYPYGPSWLFLTVPLSFIGFSYFVPTFFLFKGLIILSFVGSVYYIQKIAERIRSGTGLEAVVFFALNPLVIIESLVSSHNDTVMLFFVILSLWYLLERKTTLSVFSFLFSAGIKFVTGILLPVYVYVAYKVKKGQTPDWEKAFLAMILLMVAAMLLATYRTNFQPWYFLYALPFIALLVRRSYLFVPAILFSFGSLLQYLPYLYLGNYDPPVPSILFAMLITTGVISLFVGLLLRLKSYQP